MLDTENFNMRHYVGFSQIGSHINPAGIISPLCAKMLASLAMQEKYTASSYVASIY